MIYLALFLLVAAGVLLIAAIATLYFMSNRVLRAARQLDTLIHHGVTCGRCGSLVQGEARGHKRGDEIFLEVRSEGGTHRFAVGSQSKDDYGPGHTYDNEAARVTTRL